MAKTGSIPAWVYIIAGAGIAFFSKFVQSRTDINSLQLFFYIGLVFILIGLIKIIFKAGKKKEKALKAQPHHTAYHETHHKPKGLFKTEHQHHQTAHNSHAHHIHRTHDSQHQPKHHIHKTNQHQTHPQHPSIIVCQSCGTRHYSYANFCMKCGVRIKK